MLVKASDFGEENAPAFIVITSDGSLSRAIAAMRVGAFDFLVKPVAGTRLLATTRSAVEQRRSSVDAKPEAKPKEQDSFYGFIGQSPAMQQVYRSIE